MLHEDPGGEETEGFATRAANELLTILCSALQAVTKGYTAKKKNRRKRRKEDKRRGRNEGSAKSARIIRIQEGAAEEGGRGRQGALKTFATQRRRRERGHGHGCGWATRWTGAIIEQIVSSAFRPQRKDPTLYRERDRGQTGADNVREALEKLFRPRNSL